MSVDLRRCPLCGSKAEVSTFNYGCIIECERSIYGWVARGFSTGHAVRVQADSFEEAAKIWNGGEPDGD